MSKKVFIIHGFQSTPESDWRPWLKENLEAQGDVVELLKMPTPFDPILSEWVNTISDAVQNPNEDVYLVGHSLGVPAILNYLENLAEGKKIGGAVLVSGFYKPVIEDEEPEERKIDHFADHEFDWDKIKSVCGKCVVIHGDDDDVVPLYHAEHISKMLGCELVIVKGGGHLNTESNWNQLHEVLDFLE
ncbi:MAG: serine hydrolase [Patescibacteria group bacterium]|nr:serine hydrolase [Patescibacteria group bacterium]